MNLPRLKFKKKNFKTQIYNVLKMVSKEILH